MFQCVSVCEGVCNRVYVCALVTRVCVNECLYPGLSVCLSVC